MDTITIKTYTGICHQVLQPRLDVQGLTVWTICGDGVKYISDRYNPPK